MPAVQVVLYKDGWDGARWDTYGECVAGGDGVGGVGGHGDM